jgi:putative hydrolase of the HAD superfamily
MSIKIVVFDLGNVLFKFDLSKFVKEFLKKVPRHKNEAAGKLILEYSDVGYNYEKGNISSVGFYIRLKECTDYSGTCNEFCIIWNNIFTPIPETIEILSITAKKYPVALLSNTNELHFEYLKKCFPSVFMIFDKMFLSYKMHLRKPENEIYQNIINYYKIVPSEILFIDDLEENIEAARNNGMTAVKFTGAYELEKQLCKLKV